MMNIFKIFKKKKSERILFMVRGLPNSGKSTFSKYLVKDPDDICTADDYFMVDGEYKFDIARLSNAHQYCKDKCLDKMRNGVERVVVANTSTTEKEFEPYYSMAWVHGYNVFSVIVENRHGRKNDHNVSDDIISKMRNRFSIKL